MIKSTGSKRAFSLMWFSIRHTYTVRHLPQTARFAIFNRNEVRFQFIWYQKEISHHYENFIGNENRNEFIPEWLVREQNFVSESKNMIERNILRWNELFPEWKSFRYHENSCLLVHWDNLQNVDFGFQESHKDPAPRNWIFVVLL